MLNPFKQNGEMLPVASINSVYVEDTLAYDLFRPSLIQQEILAKRDALGLPDEFEDTSLLSLFERFLQDDSDMVRQTANDIAKTHHLSVSHTC